MEVDTIISEDIKHRMTELSKKLSADRKKRVPPPTLPQPAELKGFHCLATHTSLHKTTEPGILSLDIHPTKQNLILTGGVDSTVVLFDRESEKKLTTLTEHRKKVTGVLFHPSRDILFSCSADKTAKVWSSSAAGGYQCGHTLKAHTGGITGMSLHALEDYLVTASSDGSWAFHDIKTGNCLAHITHPESQAELTCATFHPDGLILGTGTANSVVRIWDIKSQQNVVNLEGHEGSISDLAFSENGYYLATTAEDASVKLWDLRKLKNIHTYNFTPPYTVQSLDFDLSGTYLVTGGSEISIFAAKTLEMIKSISGEHKAVITDVKFGYDSTFLASVSLDRNLKIFGA